MANGRSSCTVGAYEAAEVYSNTSGGASSVTLNAHTTDKDKCFNISVNISDTAQTIQCSTTFLSATSPSVCGCFCVQKTYGLIDDSGTFRGVSCEPTTCLDYKIFFNCDCSCVSRDCCCCIGEDYWRETVYAPVPWPGNIPVIVECCANYVEIPAGWCCSCNCTSIVVNLLCFCDHCASGTVTTNRFCEIVTNRNCGHKACLNCSDCDLDGCCGDGLGTVFRPNYGITGKSFRCHCALCFVKSAPGYTDGSFAYDYWAGALCKQWSQYGGGACNSGTCLSYVYLNLNICKACCSGACGGCLAQYCWNNNTNRTYIGRSMTTGGIACFTSCINRCSITCLGSSLARYQRVVAAGCLFSLQSQHNCYGVEVKGERALSGHYSCRLGCNRILYTADDTVMPIKWVTYNHKDCCNYFMWYHDETPLWNGIYTANIECLLCHHNCCCCAASTYPATIHPNFTKVADIPSFLPSTSKAMVNTTAVSVSDDEFIFFFDDVDSDTWSYTCHPRCQASSADLKTWTCVNDTQGISEISTDLYKVTNSTEIAKLCNCYNSILCNSGQIENQTQGINLERTGIVTSNGDKIYVTNCGTTPVSINVWGYEE